MAKTAIQEVQELDKMSILMPDQELELRNKKVIVSPFTVLDTKKVFMKINVYKNILTEQVKDFYEDDVTNEEGEVIEVKKVEFLRYKTTNEIINFLFSKIADEDNNVFDDLAFMISVGCSDLTIEDIGLLKIDEFSIIIRQILEMNMDFFKQFFQGLSDLFGFENKDKDKGKNKEAQETEEKESQVT